MPGPQLQTAHNVPIQVEAAGLGDRTLATLIDYGLIVCYVVSLLLLFRFLPGPPNVVIFLLYLPVFLYFLLCETLMNGQSFGKRVRAVRVMRLDGQAPSLSDYLLRWLLRPIDIMLTGGSAALLSILATGSGQRLGDLAAGTMVAHVRKSATLGDTILTRLPDDHRVTFEGARRLGDEDVTTTNEVLRVLTAEHTPRPATRDLARRTKVALVAKMNAETEERDLAPKAFLRTVLQDYTAAQQRPSPHAA